MRGGFGSRRVAEAFVGVADQNAATPPAAFVSSPSDASFVSRRAGAPGYQVMQGRLILWLRVGTVARTLAATRWLALFL